MWRSWWISVTTQWGACTVFLTALQLALGAATIGVTTQFPDDRLIWDEFSNWDAVSAGIILLLSTYLQAELAKHADIMTAFQKVSQCMRSVRHLRGVTDEHLRPLRDAVLSESDVPLHGAQAHLLQLYDEMQTPDSDAAAFRFMALEDALVMLKSKREYSVPRMYQRVLYTVVIFYYGVILPGAKSGASRNPWYALIDVLFIGLINNVILAAGLEAGSMFLRVDSPDFVRVAEMFSGVADADMSVRSRAFHPRFY